MSNLFDDAGSGSVSLFAAKKAAASGGSGGKVAKNELPSLFSSKPKAKPKATTKGSSKKPSTSSRHQKKATPQPSQAPPADPQSSLPPSLDNQPEVQQRAPQPSEVAVEPADSLNISPKRRIKTSRVPKEKKKVVKQVVVKRRNAHDMVNRTLNQIQRNITDQFAELFTIAESLITPPQEVSQKQPPEPLKNDLILSRIQELISDSMDKDRILQMKQVSIAKMTTTLTEREERAELRKKIANLMETIAAESANTGDAQSEHEFRVKEISRLTIEIEKIPKNCELTTQQIMASYTEDLRKLEEEFAKVKKECTERIQVSNEAKLLFTEQIIASQEERAKKPTENDLRKAVKESKAELRRTIEDVGTKISEIVKPKVNQDKKYRGNGVKKVVRMALQKVLKKFTNPDEPESQSSDEDDEQKQKQKQEEEEEEEEEAEANEEEEEEAEEENNEDENNEDENNEEENNEEENNEEENNEEENNEDENNEDENNEEENNEDENNEEENNEEENNEEENNEEGGDATEEDDGEKDE